MNHILVKSFFQFFLDHIFAGTGDRADISVFLHLFHIQIERVFHVQEMIMLKAHHEHPVIRDIFAFIEKLRKFFFLLIILHRKA